MRCLKVIAALLMLLALNTAVCFALEEETTDNYSSFYESSGADSLDDSLPDDVKDTIDSAGIDISNWQSMLSPSPKKIISMFADIARGSFKKPIKDMIIIAGVVVLVGLIKGTAAAENFSEPLNIVIGCAVAITVFASSAGVISQGMSAVEATSDFMLALIPVLAGIITAAGNPTLALTYGSFAMAAAQAAAQTAGNIITLRHLAGGHAPAREVAGGQPRDPSDILPPRILVHIVIGLPAVCRGRFEFSRGETVADESHRAENPDESPVGEQTVERLFALGKEIFDIHDSLRSAAEAAKNEKGLPAAKSESGHTRRPLFKGYFPQGKTPLPLMKIVAYSPSFVNGTLVFLV